MTKSLLNRSILLLVCATLAFGVCMSPALAEEDQVAETCTNSEKEAPAATCSAGEKAEDTKTCPADKKAACKGAAKASTCPGK